MMATHTSLIQEYLSELERTRSRSTFKGSTYALAKLPGLAQPDFMTWYGGLCDSGDKHSTKNTDLALIQMFVKWAQARGELADISLTPFRRFKPRDNEVRPAPVVLTRQEIRRLVLACPRSSCGSITLAALLTGARKMELHNFRPKQVSKDDDVITIVGQKGRAERLIDPKYLGVGLRLFQRAAKATRAPFQYDRWNDGWEHLREAAILPHLTFKALRSTVSSYMKSGGVSPWIVDATLGHSADVAAKHYDRLVPGVTGSTLPEMYGCIDDFAEACELVSWPPAKQAASDDE